MMDKAGKKSVHIQMEVSQFSVSKFINTICKEISYQPVVYHDDAFYVFGGTNEGDRREIFKLASQNGLWTWTQLGSMVKGHDLHNVIYLNGHFLVVGGSGEMPRKTEKCTLTGASPIGISCVEQEPELNYYSNWPELLPISGSTLCGADLPQLQK